MKVVVVDTIHAQICIAVSDLFEGEQQHFFITEDLKNQITAYSEGRFNSNYHRISNLDESSSEIIRFCNEENVDLLLFNPVFTHYRAVIEIAKRVQCKKAFTIHNLNSWINPRVRSINSFVERLLKKSILKQMDYLVVEDFIYEYVSNEAKHLSDKHHFLHIPSYIASNQPKKSTCQNDNLLRIVMPGTIEKERRNYEQILNVIDYFATIKAKICFSFAGLPIGDYGLSVVERLKQANKAHPGIATYFNPEKEATPAMFLHEMAIADLVIATSNYFFEATGTVEQIGKTKPTAAIHDMICFELPGLLPIHINIPTKLNGSVFNYGKDPKELISIIETLLSDRNVLIKWKTMAVENAKHFTPEEIRKGLPFF